MRFNKFVIFSLLIIAISACDTPDCPYEDKRLCNQAYLDSLDQPENENCSEVDTVYKSRVLLEDFTGFRCTNCLPAAFTANQLQEEWCDRIVVVAYHVFPEFAQPLSTTPGEPFFVDLRTDQGEDLAIDYGLPSLPNGLINRKEFSGGYIQSAGSWTDNVGQEMQQEVIAELYFEELDYNPISSTTDLSLRIAPRTAVEHDWNLAVGIFENGIVDAQKDGSETIFPYVHDHVFRKYINGTFGEVVLTPDTELDETGSMVLDFQAVSESDWIPENCYLFAILMDTENDEVIGCSKTKFIP